MPKLISFLACLRDGWDRLYLSCSVPAWGVTPFALHHLMVQERSGQFGGSQLHSWETHAVSRAQSFFDPVLYVY